MVTPEKRLCTALNAKILGSGTETLVLAHGFGTDQSIWDKILPCLAENYRLVLFDWPFAGAVRDHSLYDPLKYSSYEAFADDLITLMDELQLKATNFVGHSMSAMVSCIASIQRPDLFKRLILIAASPRYINTDDYEGGFSRTDIEQLVSNIELDYENWASSFPSMAVGPNDAASVEKFKKCLKATRPEVVHSLAKTVFASDYRRILDKVETPCTLIQTARDMAVPRSVAIYLQKELIKAKTSLEIIDTVGHFPQLTAHLQLAQVIKGAVGSDLIN